MGQIKSPFQQQLKAKLAQRLDDPHVLKDKLANLQNCYKIKLRASGYRLVYKVIQDRIVVQVIAIGKRDKEEVYRLARYRLT